MSDRLYKRSSFLQVIAVLYCLITWVFGGFIGTAALLYILFFTKFYFLSIAYLLWIFYDKEARRRGGKSFRRFRKWVLFRHLKDYFPINLVKTVDLDPQKNYIFCSYPHGILCVGILSSFATDAADVRKIFPNIETHVVTFDILFWLAYVREFILNLGFISASEESLDYMLSIPSGGHAAVLVLGGYYEMLEAHENTYKFHVKKRSGFARLALKHGTPLVPVISFGENDLFWQLSNPKGSWIRWFQDYYYKWFKVAPIFIYGKFFLVPRRRPVTVVVGRPIEVKKVCNPTTEQIEELRNRFINGLVELFEKEKYKYLPDPDKTFVQII